MNKFLSNKSMSDPLEILNDIHRVKVPDSIQHALKRKIEQESIPKLWWMAMAASFLLMLSANFFMYKSNNVPANIDTGDLAESSFIYQQNHGFYDY